MRWLSVPTCQASANLVDTLPEWDNWVTVKHSVSSVSVLWQDEIASLNSSFYLSVAENMNFAPASPFLTTQVKETDC